MSDDLTTEPFDATDPAAEANAKRDAARIVRENSDVLKLIMGSKPGRAWLCRQLQSCHIYSSTFMPGQSDVTAFQLGEENYGKKLMLAAQNASVELYMQMIKESQAEEKRLEEVRRTEERNRRKEEETTNPSAFVPDLPPPAGYPGGPALPRNKKQGKSEP